MCTSINADTVHDWPEAESTADMQAQHKQPNPLPALADQDEPVRGKHTCTRWIPLVPKTSHPTAGSKPWSLSCSPQLLAPGYKNPQGLKPCCSGGHADMHTHTPWSPPGISLRHWLYPAAESRIPWSPRVLTHRCKLLFQLVSRPRSSSWKFEQLTHTHLHST